eukprot:COSAG02_NODE_2475_length_8735_cov_5.368110_8_plen_63_part_00
MRRVQQSSVALAATATLAHGPAVASGCSHGIARKALTWARIDARAATTEAWSVGSTACVQAW